MYNFKQKQDVIEVDNCFTDITIEFLSVVFNNILYYSSIYPDAVFEKRKKYSIVAYACIHPEVNKYIELCLKTILECIKKGQLSRIEFTLTNCAYTPLVKFMFDFEDRIKFDDTLDAYLVHCEQNMRAFCLSLSSSAHLWKELPENASFTIFVHTNESMAVTLATDPNLEEFPMVEVIRSNDEAKRIIPLREFSIRSFNLSTYIEL